MRVNLDLVKPNTLISIFQSSRKNHNKLVYSQTRKYNQEQQELYDSNMFYLRITKLLNKKGVKTHTGKEWGETGNSVYSVLKKYRQREESLELLNKEYELEWGTMEVKWEKN